ncbi:MAG: sialidase family protein [Solirubrobacteraceae bacterium]
MRADCTLQACAPLTLAGDPPFTFAHGAESPVHGYADPSLRRVPGGRRIWMAYSWLRYDVGKPVHVDSHLAHSNDGGRTWRFDRVLWRSRPATDPTTGRAGFSNTETVSLAPLRQGRRTTWYSARMEYVTVAAAGPRVPTFVVRIARASSPLRLAGGPEQTLGGGLTRPSIRVDQDLSLLSPELAGCTFFDAGLLARRGRLYLAVQCARWTLAGEDFAHEFVAVFGARPSGPLRRLRWRYLGPLTDHADALALGDQTLQQTDLAVGRDGRLLALVSPGHKGSASILNAHIGCRALRIGSLDPPRLARDRAGHPRVVASVTATDDRPDGPGACGYDPASATGIVIEHREVGLGRLVGVLVASHVRP